MCASTLRLSCRNNRAPGMRPEGTVEGGGLHMGLSPLRVRLSLHNGSQLPSAGCAAAPYTTANE